jgi:hypothetical protein
MDNLHQKLIDNYIKNKLEDLEEPEWKLFTMKRNQALRTARGYLRKYANKGTRLNRLSILERDDFSEAFTNLFEYGVDYSTCFKVIFEKVT